MITFTKALAGTVAAGALAASAVSPAAAQDHRRHDGRHDGGISAGEVIAGAVVIGGIAALAASQDRNGYRGSRWNGGNPRQAVNQCVRVAERNAGRLRGDVTDVRNVRATRTGYEVRGRIAVKTFAGQWRGRGQYGHGWNGDYRGWNRNLRGYDAGSFTCHFERGRVTHVDYRGIRGL